VIFNIAVHYEDADTKEVILDMALEDFEAESWRVALILDKTQLDVAARLTSIARCNGNEDIYRDVPRNEVPEWVKRLVIRLTPRMHEVMEHGTAIRRWVEEEAA
jgi:hypothetical protein